MKKKANDNFSWGKVPAVDVLDSIFSEMEKLDHGEVLNDDKKKRQNPEPPATRAAPAPKKEKIDYTKLLPPDWKEKKEVEEKNKKKISKAVEIEIDASELAPKNAKVCR